MPIRGCLTGVTLTGGGFLPSPVLAWPAGGAFAGWANWGEASPLVSRPALEPVHPDPGSQKPSPPSREDPMDSHPGTGGAVTGVLIDLLIGMFARADVHYTTEVEFDQVLV